MKGILKLPELTCVREISDGDHWGKRHSSLAIIYRYNLTAFLEDVSQILKVVPQPIFIKVLTNYLAASQANRVSSKFNKIISLLGRKISEKLNVNLGREYILHSEHESLDMVSKYVKKEL